MAAALLNQLNAFMLNMFNAGLLDDQFQQLQMLQEDGSPGFVGEIVAIFCEDANKIIREIARLLDNKPYVDFDRVDAFVHQLKGGSASIGAARVKNTCVRFRDCCQQKSRDGCLKALDSVRNDFYDLRHKFQIMLQLERQIQAIQSSNLEQQGGAHVRKTDWSL